MAIKVEVVTPVSAVGDVTGESTVVSVVRTTQSPVTTNSNQAVIEVVSSEITLNARVSATPPAEPYLNMVWIDIS